MEYANKTGSLYFVDRVEGGKFKGQYATFRETADGMCSRFRTVKLPPRGTENGAYRLPL